MPSHFHLLQLALEKRPDELEAFLANECPDDAVKAEIHRRVIAARDPTRPLGQGATAFGQLLGDAIESTGMNDRSGTSHDHSAGYSFKDRLTGELRWHVVDVKCGGMGMVYLVVDETDRQQYALKTHARWAFDTFISLRQAFLEETRRWIALPPHGNIVRAIQPDQIENHDMLVLEYWWGGSLSRWIGTEYLTENPLIGVMYALQICDGLRHAYRNGITAHLDIKPSNCLVNTKYRRQSVDFSDNAAVMVYGRSPLGLTDFGIS